jgi:hypothetical protein
MPKRAPKNGHRDVKPAYRVPSMAEIAAVEPERCRCRPPRRHRDCMYCGTSWAGEVVCGVCRAAGIDGRVIRGTSGAVCSRHRSRD